MVVVFFNSLSPMTTVVVLAELHGDSRLMTFFIIFLRIKNSLFLQQPSVVSSLSKGSRETIFPLLLIALCLNENPSEEVKNDLKTTRI